MTNNINFLIKQKKFLDMQIRNAHQTKTKKKRSSKQEIQGYGVEASLRTRMKVVKKRKFSRPLNHFKKFIRDIKKRSIRW